MHSHDDLSLSKAHFCLTQPNLFRNSGFRCGAFFMTCPVYCLIVVFGIFVLHCDHLFGKDGTVYFAFLCFVLSVIVRFPFLLVLLTGYFLRLCLFLDIFCTVFQFDNITLKTHTPLRNN